MADRPSIPEILEGTLAHRGELLGEVVPTSLDGVARRVQQRRAARRRVAVGGAAAVIAAGAAGLLLVRRGDDTVPAAGSTDTGSAALPSEVWRCVGDLGQATDDPDGRYFTTCEEVDLPDALGPAATATTAPAVQPEQTYTVVAGDSIFSIAEQYGLEMDTLANYNRWEDGIDHVLDIGDVVRIPPGAPPSPADTTASTSG